MPNHQSLGERGAGSDNDPSDRNGPDRGRSRNRLPAEFANFKLADGRTLREVMGDRFFGAGRQLGRGKFLSKRVRDRLGRGVTGNAPPPVRESLTGIAKRVAKQRASAGAQAAKRRPPADPREARRQARLAAARGVGSFLGGGL